MTSAVADIYVIGGGPAGCIAALELARLGFSVRLVQRTTRKVHWPETLSPQLISLLNRLGLISVLAAAEPEPVSEKWLLWDGTDPVRVAQPGSTAVHREKLEAGLLQSAIAAG